MFSIDRALGDLARDSRSARYSSTTARRTSRPCGARGITSFTQRARRPFATDWQRSAFRRIRSDHINYISHHATRDDRTRQDGRQHGRAADARRAQGRRCSTAAPTRSHERSRSARPARIARRPRRQARRRPSRLDHGARRASRSTTRSPTLAPGLSKGDIIIDGGNSNFHDTMRRGAGARGATGSSSSTPARAAASGDSRTATA